MPRVLNIAAARARLTILVQEAYLEQGRTLLGKHGVLMAALLPIRGYEELLQDLENLRDMLQAEQEYCRTGGRDLEDVVKKLKGHR